MKLAKIFFYGLLIICCHACQQSSNIKDEVDNLLNSNIALLVDSMEEIRPTYLSESRIQCEHLKIVLFNDSLKCSTCEVRTLGEWDNFAQILKREKNITLNLIPIFSPSASDYLPLKSALKNSKPSFPVYLDTANCFIRSNPQIPSNKLYHTFVLDDQNRVVIIGNIMKNKRLYHLFLDCIETIP